MPADRAGQPGTGLLVWGGASNPFPQATTTLAVGEEDATYGVYAYPESVTKVEIIQPGYHRTTTLRSGESLTITLAIGEEEGGYTATPPSGPITTAAIGEEEAIYLPATSDWAVPTYGGTAGPFETPDYGGTATTLAIGEEDGSYAAPVETPAYGGTATTLAIGEEDGGTATLPVYDNYGAPPIHNGGTVAAPDVGYAPSLGNGGIATTLALGEEDGSYLPSGPIPVEPDGGIGDGAGPIPVATTYAIGEEDGGYSPPVYDVIGTTEAIGEEDGGYAPTQGDGMATTLALGEEDGGYGTAPDYGALTTLAVGEEDGSGPIPVEPGGYVGGRAPMYEYGDISDFSEASTSAPFPTIGGGS